tara:strand:+ start:24831 stop:25742 length:912 start_codon:yes stop_codon:yes gene_type:complete
MRIFLTGHKGLLGSAIYRELNKKKNLKLLISDKKNLNLENYQNTEIWFKKNKPTHVINAAAKAGGIEDNSSYPVDYMMTNIKIQTNLIDLCYKYKVKKFLFIGSSCMYPKFSKIPIKETELLKGELEQTNQWYALTKIHGVKLCEAYNKQYGKNFSCAMPTNLFGPNDKYDERSHVIPALIKRMHNAKINKDLKVKVWGDGRPKREFLYVNDCAKIICKILLDNKYYKLINIGTNEDITIKNLAQIIKKIVGFKGELEFDNKMPNGVMRKTMDISKIKKLKYNKFTDFEKALRLTYKDFLSRF